MLEVIQTVVALVVTLSILVTIHEFGHYWVARLCNVQVLRFSIGFGKPLYIKRGRPPVKGAEPGTAADGSPVEIRTRSNEPLEGTEFAIAAIPLGGYVKMLDERQGFVPDDRKHLAFNRKNVWQRIAIVSAGPAANFLLAIAAYWLLFVTGVSGVIPVIGEVEQGSKAEMAGLEVGQEVVAVDGRATGTWADVKMRLFDRLGETGSIVFSVTEAGGLVKGEHVVEVEDWLSGSPSPWPTGDLGLFVQFPEVPAVIGGLVAGGRAQAAGVKAGDEIRYVNARTIAGWRELVEEVQANPEKPLSFELMREGSVITLQVTPEKVERDGGAVGFIGARPAPTAYPDEMRRRVSHPVYSAWIPALQKTREVTAFTLNSIKKMVMGAISPSNLAGPITIAQVASATAASGFESFIGFIALLSISLGVINLLPVPALDGGHLLYYLVEVFTGRPLPERIQLRGLQFGVFLIVGIMLLAIYNDLTRL